MSKPIFIIGCPRSGTTITLKIMALHEQLAWVSDYLNRHPEKTQTSKRNKIYDLPLVGEQLYFAATQNQNKLPERIKNYLPFPVEPWDFWNNYLSNFQWKRGGDTPPRRRTVKDITTEEINKIRAAIESIEIAQGKDRFLSKYTDFPRMTYLTQAFPDAIFIHIIRDGRAVAASYHYQIEHGIFRTWNEREWWISGWPQEWQTEWRNKFGSSLSFVTFQWKFFVSEILKDAENIPPRQYLEINYSDIIKSPVETFNKIFTFCDLKQSPKVERYLNKIHLGNMDEKWKKRYSDSEKKELEQIIHEPEFRKLLNE